MGDRAKTKKDKDIAKIATVIVVGGMLLIFLLDIATVLLANHDEKKYPIPQEFFAFVGTNEGSRIHFLNTDNSDAILLESEGHFALIDSGWGSDNPNKNARRTGYETRILDYLQRVARDANGQVTLDFVLVTHYHYDHAGGFAGILSDKNVNVKTAYFRPLQGALHNYELERWELDEIHARLLDVAAERGIPVEENPPTEPFAFGAMRLRFLNTDSYKNEKYSGENDNSVITLVQYGKTRALLTGDASNLHGLEKDIARQVGRVDLLKICHHGYFGSNSMFFLKTLQAKAGIVTNGLGQIYPNVKWNLTMVARLPTYSTVRENGIIATLRGDGTFYFTGNLHRTTE
ncbi:MAG: MBL fold metallo-hydrolase [Oscillospiraceae bacterium]|jgi:beta-lactamase superfamily II metal-dependent hydrolase|nr:MBL fold metallo-hydrolase [Oscillospiraceae bacterium]